MKQFYVLFLFVIPLIAFSQCPTAPITLTSQAEVDAFATNYPTCSTFTNDISITGNDITNLSGLSQITEVSAIYVQDNPMLNSLSGLQNITLAENVYIINNPLLTDLTGLSALQSASSLYINNNTTLQSFYGLAAMVTLNTLLVQSNASLTSIDAIANVSFNSNSFITIISNTNLSECAINSVCGIVTPASGGLFSIANNAVGCESYQDIFEQCTGCPYSDITFTTQAEVDAYPLLYPNCNELNGQLQIWGNDIVDLTPLNQITAINGNLIVRQCPILTSLNGLQNIGNFRSINLYSNENLSDISAISQVTTVLEFVLQYNDALIEIPQLQLQEATSFNIENNLMLTSLAGFSNLTTVNGPVNISGNPALSNFNGLENLITATNLEIDDNITLENINALSNLQSDLSTLVITENTNLQNLQGLESLNTVSNLLWIKNNNTLQNLDGLVNLTNQNTSGANLTLEIQFNPLLTDISGLSYINPDTLYRVIVGNNETLAECSILLLCDALQSLSIIFYVGNNTGDCYNQGVLDNCSNNLNVVSGTVLFDFNNNNCDTDDYLAGNLMVRATKSTGQSVSTTTDVDGNYELRLPSGTFNIEILPESLPINFSASPLQSQVDFTTTGNTQNVNFCLTANTITNDVNVTLLPMGSSRPGFMSEYLLIYQNNGATVSNGTITLTFDTDRQSYLTADPEQENIDTNTITWNYTNLMPFHSEQIIIKFNNEPPPTNNSDDILVFNLSINPADEDLTPADNTYILEQAMVNSFDPNDKAVSQGTEIYEDEIGKYLDYVIRFQNTGTADAINVRVNDELSSLLDWDTFKITAKSHTSRIEISNENEIAFVFENINLPPQQLDEEGSKGYIAFKIKPIAGLILGDIISNQASIYFDYNAPIITNTVLTEYAEVLNIDELPSRNTLKLFPNPIMATLNIKSQHTIDTLKIYNLLGQPIKSISPNASNTQVDMSSLNAGIYILKVSSANHTATYKIIKD